MKKNGGEAKLIILAQLSFLKNEKLLLLLLYLIKGHILTLYQMEKFIFINMKQILLYQLLYFHNVILKKMKLMEQYLLQL